ncbi:hypothetical protein KQI63_00080 [bacterium]|nr:hypothetical protein [bacterium]
MTRGQLTWLVLLALPFTVPWWFSGTAGTSLLGMPSWALYGLISTLAYACLVAWIMAKKWHVLASEEDEDE